MRTDALSPAGWRPTGLSIPGFATHSSDTCSSGIPLAPAGVYTVVWLGDRLLRLLFLEQLLGRQFVLPHGPPGRILEFRYMVLSGF